MSPYLEEGVRLFSQGDYFLAHETLEEHWIEAPEKDRDFLQGLIHLSVGFLHHGRGNTKGTMLQFKKAARRLESYPDEYEGVDVAGVRAFLEGATGTIDETSSLSPPKLMKAD